MSDMPESYFRTPVTDGIEPVETYPTGYSPVEKPKKKFFTPATILIGALAIVAIAALAWGTLGQVTTINDNAKIAAQTATIKSLTVAKNNLTADLQDAQMKLSTAKADYAQCLAQSNSLTQELSAVQTQLTNWSADPLGYTLDPTQITQFRDAAAADTCPGSIDPNVPSS